MTKNIAAENTPDRQADYWISQIRAAQRREENWRKEAQTALQRYVLESQQGQYDGGGRFNILWSNTETLRNAVYNVPPAPDVRQRWDTKDPAALAAAETLDRALTYTIERSGFDIVARRAVLDYLLPGRSVVRLRYDPVIAPAFDEMGQPMLDETGAALEQLNDETVQFENIAYTDFVHSEARAWEKVEWIAFRHFFTRDDAKKLFPPDAYNLLSFTSRLGETDDTALGENNNQSSDEAADRALVWEIWDKPQGRVVWVAEGVRENGGVLYETDPPLDLEGFFPTPRPMYAVEQPDRLVPMPFYSQYKEQAQELDRVTSRIKAMVGVVKYRGIYDAAMGGDIARIVDEGEDGSFIPSDNAVLWREVGGLGNALWTMPLADAIAALEKLYQSREQTKQVIYEITGISDVLRGSTDARETATAQQIKAQWGSSRVGGMKREVQRYFKDLLEIAAEIIGEHFQVETLKTITGLPYPTEQEKQQAAMQLQQIQAMQEQAQMGDSGQPPPPMPPEMQQAEELLQQPSWDEVKQIISSDGLRSCKVDIETDSTIAPDQRAEMQAFSETMQMVGGLLQQVMPGVQSGVLPPDLAMALLTATIRKTPLANEMTSILQKYEEELMGGNPLQEEINALKQENSKLQEELENKQGEIAVKAAGVQQKEAQIQGEQVIDAADLQLRWAEMQERAAAAHVLPQLNAEGL